MGVFLVLCGLFPFTWIRWLGGNIWVGDKLTRHSSYLTVRHTSNEYIERHSVYLIVRQSSMIIFR